MIQDHRNQLIAIDELVVSKQTNTLKYREDEEAQAKIMFTRAENIKRAEMERRAHPTGGSGQGQGGLGGAAEQGMRLKMVVVICD